MAVWVAKLRVSVLLQVGLRMSVRDPDSLSRANGVYFVVDHV